MTAKVNKKTIVYKNIKPIAPILLTGKVLCIDPSTGSHASLPGWAWFEGGEFKESGEIEVNIHANKSRRLFEIARTIREEFPTPDVLVVEYIPPVTFRGGMNSIALMGLQRSIGAIMGAHPFEHLLEVPTAAWGKYKPEWYKKCDEHDAIVIGICAMAIARHIVEEKD